MNSIRKKLPLQLEAIVCTDIYVDIYVEEWNLYCSLMVFN